MKSSIVYSPYISSDGVDWTTPLDQLIAKEDGIENSDLRDAALRYMEIISLAVSFIIEGNDPLVNAYAVAYALKLPAADIAQRDLARTINVSHGTISAASNKFQSLIDL